MSTVTEEMLIVESRDLDTDARSVATLEVEMPADHASQRAQFERAVAPLHPAARLRSFGNGAASFLDSQSLIVAYYCRSTEAPSSDRRARHTAEIEQQVLFAA
jgi:hypothetical protein